MSTSRKYLEFILQQLSSLEDIMYRPMMSEFILYYRGKIIGGLYDNKLLVKPVHPLREYIPNALYEAPYKGAKKMLLVDNVDDPDYLAHVFNIVYDALPSNSKR